MTSSDMLPSPEDLMDRLEWLDMPPRPEDRMDRLEWLDMLPRPEDRMDRLQWLDMLITNGEEIRRTFSDERNEATLKLVEDDGVSIHAAADQLGISRTAVRKRMARARAKRDESSRRPEPPTVASSGGPST